MIETGVGQNNEQLVDRDCGMVVIGAEERDHARARLYLIVGRSVLQAKDRTRYTPYRPRSSLR
jgi:hypothetical protein